MTSAKVVLDSYSPQGIRLTTMEVTFHRFVLAEFNTHRVFSRNSASSRAIPVEKQLERYSLNPAIPIVFPEEQAGMQGGHELGWPYDVDAKNLVADIHTSIESLVGAYLEAHPNKETRLHKSIINRYLEPFLFQTVIVSSTEWSNFFKQRCSPMAQPEIKLAAEMMKAEYDASEPTLLERGQWHTPYIQDHEDFDVETAKAVSVARCARVSYLTHDGVRDVEKDIELYQRLVSADPGHWSPLEHVARPAVSGDLSDMWSDVPDEDTLGNFRGWAQLRHYIESQ